MRTCPVRKPSYEQNPIPDTSKKQDSIFGKKRKSMTVYSATNHPSIQGSKIQSPSDLKPKQKLQLLSKNQLSRHQRLTLVEKQEQKPVKKQVNYKMNLCGAKFCELSIENRYYMCDEVDQDTSKDDKLSRVIYTNKKDKQLPNRIRKPQSVFNRPNVSQKIGVYEQDFSQLTCPNSPTALNSFSTKQKSKNQRLLSTNQSFKKGYRTDFQKEIPLEKTELKFYTRQTEPSMTLLMENQASESKPFRLQNQIAKQNSLSIVNYSTNEPSKNQSCDWNHSSGLELNLQNSSLDKINKLKEIYLNQQPPVAPEYLNTYRTSSSYQYDEICKWSPKNSYELTFSDSVYFPMGNEKEKLDRSKTNPNLTGALYRKESLPDQRPEQANTPRTIIDKLNNLDSQSEISFAYSLNDEMRLQNSLVSQNPEGSIYSPSIQMQKPFRHKIKE